MYYYFNFSMRKAFPILLFLFTNSYISIAQNYPSDCPEAYQICHLGDYHFSNMEGCGIQEDLNLENVEIKETNSIWLQFAVELGGNFEFVIVPENQEDDIDFILYEGDECANLEPIRIMTSGEVIGIEASIACLGQTGLRNSSDDIHESNGCFDFDDNFLKPVRLVKSKSYYLFINNFNSEEGFNILFSGEESLKLIDKCDYKMPSSIDFNIYPNPVLDEITLKSGIIFSNPVEVVMFDLSGKILQRKIFKNMTEERKMDVSNIPSGEYYLRIVSGGYTGLKSLVKI